jgi:hypothetical protein
LSITQNLQKAIANRHRFEKMTGIGTSADLLPFEALLNIPTGADLIA